MSSDQNPPKNRPRKPRYFRPGDVGLSGSENRPAGQESDAVQPKVVRPPETDSPERSPSASAKPDRQPAQTEPIPQGAPLHQPRDKQPQTDPVSDSSSFENGEVPGDNGDASGNTLPTLKDIKSGFRWTAIAISAAGMLAAMAFTSWLHSHIAGLMAREDWIGWTALGLVAIVCLALAMIAIREILALRRLDRLGHIRMTAERAIRHDERKPAQKVQAQITSLFQGRHSLSWGLANLREHQQDVLSARDRMILVERSVIAPLDRDARKLVAESARRVSVMTAISPFVFLDMLMVGVENFRMLSRLMALYGGRPGLFSQFKMIKMMIANLALSGGVAVGADLIGHVMGRQVATRLAGRIGEGMINGSLTARLGITATKLIRPLPYIEARPTTITTFIRELTRGSKKA